MRSNKNVKVNAGNHSDCCRASVGVCRANERVRGNWLAPGLTSYFGNALRGIAQLRLTYVHMYAHLCESIRVYTHISTYIRMYMHLYPYIRTDIHIYTYMYAY